MYIFSWAIMLTFVIWLKSSGNCKAYSETQYLSFYHSESMSFISLKLESEKCISWLHVDYSYLVLQNWCSFYFKLEIVLGISCHSETNFFICKMKPFFLTLDHTCGNKSCANFFCNFLSLGKLYLIVMEILQKNL